MGCRKLLACHRENSGISWVGVKQSGGLLISSDSRNDWDCWFCEQSDWQEVLSYLNDFPSVREGEYRCPACCVWISGVFMGRMADIARVLQSLSALRLPGSRQLEEKKWNKCSSWATRKVTQNCNLNTKTSSHHRKNWKKKKSLWLKAVLCYCQCDGQIFY